MAKRKLYIYNAETDNFERLYPTLQERVWRFSRFWLAAILAGAAIYLLVFYAFAAPTERNLRNENARLKSQYGVLQKRLESALQVMSDISARDDNFYRVMMQMEPLSDAQRLAGLDNDARYRELRSMGDAALAIDLSRGLDLLEKQICTQSLSFDQLRAAANDQRDKFEHVPGILPLHDAGAPLTGGFGYRRDPVTGATKFHEGLDYATPTGTAVYATADGRVTSAERKPAYGNCIEIDHGYNYTTRYAHLSQMDVKEGQEVKRGELIGRVGSTGKSMGSHLHYEVRYRGEPENPVHYFFLDLTPAQYEKLIEADRNAGHVMD